MPFSRLRLLNLTAIWSLMAFQMGGTLTGGASSAASPQEAPGFNEFWGRVTPSQSQTLQESIAIQTLDDCLSPMRNDPCHGLVGEVGLMSLFLCDIIEREKKKEGSFATSCRDTRADPGSSGAQRSKRRFPSGCLRLS